MEIVYYNRTKETLVQNTTPKIIFFFFFKIYYIGTYNLQ